MRKIMYLSAILLMFAVSDACAKKVESNRYFYYYKPHNWKKHSSCIDDSMHLPIDSIKHAIDTKKIDYVFFQSCSLVGLLWNRYVQGDKHVGEQELMFSYDTDNGDIRKTDEIDTLLTYIREQNLSGKTKIKIRGFVLSGNRGVYSGEFHRVPEYEQTSILDLLSLYYNLLLIESYNEHIFDYLQKLACYAEKMMVSNKQIKHLLKDEYDIWLKRICELKLMTKFRRDMDDEEIEEALCKDFQWMDKQCPGNKIIICPKTLGDKLAKLK